MLVLSRKLNEAIVIDGRVTVTVVAVKGNRVKLGIEAPAEIGVHRREIYVALDEPMPLEHACELAGCA